MEYRALGESGLKVSTVALGGWLTQGRTISNEDTKRLVMRAQELGVNLFDTADVYSRGESERALGEAIKGLRRQEFVVATKCFWPISEAVNDRGLSRKHIIESVNESFKRLQVDYIDLFQCHRHDPETPVEETVRTIHGLIQQGKILYWGVSEWTETQILEACETARALNCIRPISNQPEYNMLQRKIESAVAPMCVKQGMGMIVWSPLAQGVLTGKYKPGLPPPPHSRAADEKTSTFMSEYLSEKVLQAVHKLEPIAADAGCSLAQFALAWCLRLRGVSSVIVGARSVEQLEENVRAAEVTIRPALFARAEELLSEALA